MPNDEALLPLDEAQGRILGLVRALPSEAARLEDAVGRALSDDVLAKRTLPPWDNSAMDGYALRAADVPGELRVVETIYAGARSQRTLGPGECARIFTGAPLPPGADAVEMQERVIRLDEGRVRIDERVARGNFVRSAGEDARAGELLLPSGTVLGIPECAMLWAQGITAASVPRRPRVAILSSGDELVRPEDASGDRIVDTNSPALALAVRAAGAEPRLVGIARDSLEDVTRVIEAARPFDVLVTSGGVSVGEKDFVRSALDALGARMSFWKVAIKPGKPLTFGQLGDAWVFGLPGNPASSLVTFELFVRPALRRMMGRSDCRPLVIPGRADVSLTKPAGLTHLLRATVEWREDGLWARPLSSQTSGAIRSTVQATHLIRLAPETTRVERGDAVELLPLAWSA